jgi:hypothetical protein
MSYWFLFFLFQGIAMLGLFGWFYWAYMFSQAPHAPDATHTVGMPNHSVVVYFTPFEAAFGPASGLLTLVAAIVSVYFRNKAT